MAQSRYKSFLRLLQGWPRDPTKSAKRDLGALLRQKVGEAFPQGESSTVPDTAKCDRTLEALQKISSDYYKKKYLCDSEVGALGVSYEEIHECASDDGLKELALEHGDKRFKFRLTGHGRT